MDKAFTVSLCNPDKDTYVTLELPADPYAVLDAWERLRLAPDTRVEWEMEDYGEFPVLFPGLQSGEGFPALNALAERLVSLSEQQRTAFEGLVRLESSRSGIIPLRTFAALAEQAEHCQVVPEATDDASLGRVYAANGSIPEVKDVPDKVFELLDFQLLGRRIRQSAGGVFTRQGLMVLAERDSLARIKYKAVLEVSSISSLEDAMALTERLDAYNLNWAAASPEDVARGELRRSMGEENADLLCWYLNLYGYGEALIQQYGGELTDYGLLTRADGQPVQKPLPPQPTRGGVQMEMR